MDFIDSGFLMGFCLNFGFCMYEEVCGFQFRCYLLNGAWEKFVIRTLGDFVPLIMDWKWWFWSQYFWRTFFFILFLWRPGFFSWVFCWLASALNINLGVMLLCSLKWFFNAWKVDFPIYEVPIFIYLWRNHHGHLKDMLTNCSYVWWLITYSVCHCFFHLAFSLFCLCTIFFKALLFCNTSIL